MPSQRAVKAESGPRWSERLATGRWRALESDDDPEPEKDGYRGPPRPWPRGEAEVHIKHFPSAFIGTVSPFI